LRALAGIGGYVVAARAPFWLGGDHSLGASGMVAVATGVILAAAYGARPAMAYGCGAAAPGSG
jgi:hypothetical protein